MVIDMDKLYQQAEAGLAPEGFVVKLDGEAAKTPLGNPLLLPTLALAQAVAAEWNAQEEKIVPATMPLTQLANTWIDKVEGEERAEMEKVILEYAGSDLICYFASHPQDLVAMQEEEWLPLLAWLKDTCGIALKTASGIGFRMQEPEALALFAEAVRSMTGRDFTVLQAVTRATGSVVVALAMVCGHLDAEDAFYAACVDERYQLAKWGVDEVAQKRLDSIDAELVAAEQFLKLSDAASDLA